MISDTVRIKQIINLTERRDWIITLVYKLDILRKKNVYNLIY